MSPRRCPYGSAKPAVALWLQNCGGFLPTWEQGLLPSLGRPLLTRPAQLHIVLKVALFLLNQSNPLLAKGIPIQICAGWKETSHAPPPPPSQPTCPKQKSLPSSPFQPEALRHCGGTGRFLYHSLLGPSSARHRWLIDPAVRWKQSIILIILKTILL